MSKDITGDDAVEEMHTDKPRGCKSRLGDWGNN